MKTRIALVIAALALAGPASACEQVVGKKQDRVTVEPAADRFGYVLSKEMLDRLLDPRPMAEAAEPEIQGPPMSVEVQLKLFQRELPAKELAGVPADLQTPDVKLPETAPVSTPRPDDAPVTVAEQSK